MRLTRETNLYDDQAIKSVDDKTTAKYGVSETSHDASAKVVAIDGKFTLYKGARISVLFKNANTASLPTMNVNNTGAKAIWAYGSPLDGTTNKFNWASNSTIEFVYDGEHWLVADSGAVGLIDEYDQSLTQEVVFNKLTDNGVIRGLFMRDGQMYINMDYLQTGILKVGGANNGNGIFEVYNSSGTRVGLWNNGALYVGNVSGTSQTPSNPNTKIDTAGAITTKSLTANDYVYVDGNSDTFFRIPYYITHSTGNASGTLTLSKSGGFVAEIGSGQEKNTIDFSYKSHLNSRYYYGFRLKQVYANMYVDLSGGSITMFDGADNVSIFEVYKGRFYVNAGNGDVFYKASYGGYIISALTVNGALRVDETKSRLVKTKDYGGRLLYSYETPSPTFGDIGEGTISDDGKCYVQIDGVFAETVTLNQYQVFLQKYGDGDCWVSERKGSYFIVEGTPGLSFGWELKAKQSDFDQYRLEEDGLTDINTQNIINYAQELEQHIQEIKHEREVA